MRNQPLNQIILQQLQHRCVQDLAWCVFSPPLVDAIDGHCRLWPELTPEILTQLRVLDENPIKLKQWLSASTSPRLGIIFERYWQYWWTTNTQREQWHFNLQINKDGRTLGELDALEWRANVATLHHYELAVKFYLQVPSESLGLTPDQNCPHRWVGPNLNDRFDIKWPQMRDRQLTALKDPARAPDLSWAPETVVTSSVTRGRLFTPLFAFPELATQTTAPELCPDYETGYWLHLDDWQRLDDGHWRILDRQEWFAPLHGEDRQELTTHEETYLALIEHFRHYRQPLQVILTTDTLVGWQEYRRYFVVPSGWPSNR
mgnify:CR=1 FL=1